MVRTDEASFLRGFPDQTPLVGDELLRVLPLAKAGNPAAQHRMLGAVAPMIVKTARHYNVRSKSAIADLCQEGALMLVRLGLPKYDPAQSAWVTFARYWVRAGIQRAAVNDQGSMSLPRGAFFERNVRLDIASLDAPLMPGINIDLGDTLAGDLGDHDETLAMHELKGKLSTLLHPRYLDARPVFVYCRHVREGATFAQIGKTLGLSRERIRQLETVALHCIEEFLHDDLEALPTRRCIGWPSIGCPNTPRFGSHCALCWGSLERDARDNLRHQRSDPRAEPPRRVRQPRMPTPTPTPTPIPTLSPWQRTFAAHAIASARPGWAEERARVRSAYGRPRPPPLLQKEPDMDSPTLKNGTLWARRTAARGPTTLDDLALFFDMPRTTVGIGLGAARRCGYLDVADGGKITRTVQVRLTDAGYAAVEKAGGPLAPDPNAKPRKTVQERADARAAHATAPRRPSLPAPTSPPKKPRPERAATVRSDVVHEYRYPIRPDAWAELRLPADLSRSDVARLCKFLETLPFDADE